MRGKCGVYALRDFHEMLASKSLVFLMTVSALGKRISIPQSSYAYALREIPGVVLL